MMTQNNELWYRNPHNYINELVECGPGYSNVIWDYGVIVKRKIDPVKHAELFFGQSLPWRMLVVGEQGCAEYMPGDEFGTPRAVYPVFRYGEDFAILEEIVQRPVGDDPQYTGDKSLLPTERPIAGQEHRVVITDTPNAGHIHGRHFFKQLKELQEDHPECIIHVHGLYSYKYLFASGFRSVDFDPRTSAQKGKVYVASGRELRYEEVAKRPEWARALGMKPIDLAIPRNRCMFNIKSAMWAKDNYHKLHKFRTQPVTDLTREEIDAPAATFEPREKKSAIIGKQQATEGDKIACDSCSLNLSCTFYREGAVCSLPSAESKKLADMFRTRDSSTIIDALGILLGKQAERLETGLRLEEEFDELSGEVSKIMGSLMTNGVKLAKLVDPALNKPALALQINNNGPGSAASIVAGADPKQLAIAVTRQLVASGIPPESITPEMVMAVIGKAEQQAIEAGSDVQDAEIVE